MKNILVIGASGFIGHNIYEFAQKKGGICLGTQFSSKVNDFLPFDLASQDIMKVIPRSFWKGNGPTYVIICSAMCKLDKCYYEREKSMATNVTGTINLINQLQKNGVKFVFISSEFVFDGLVGYYDETVPTSPVNEYGRQKVAVEKYILDHCDNYLIVRLSKVVSDDPAEEHFFSDTYKKVLRQEPIHCIEGQLFSPTDVRDVAEGIFRALELNLNGLYHLTNPEYFLRDELARQFLISIGKETEVIAKPLEQFGFPEKRSMKTYLDGHKFIRETGMQFTLMKEVMGRFAAKIS